MDCVLSDIKNAKIGTGRSSQGIEGYGGGPLWRRRPHWAVMSMKKKFKRTMDLNLTSKRSLFSVHIEN